MLYVTRSIQHILLSNVNMIAAALKEWGNANHHLRLQPRNLDCQLSLHQLCSIKQPLKPSPSRPFFAEQTRASAASGSLRQSDLLTALAITPIH